MSHQTDWGYNQQPIKTRLEKVNHVCEDSSDFRAIIFVLRIPQAGTRFPV